MSLLLADCGPFGYQSFGSLDIEVELEILNVNSLCNRLKLSCSFYSAYSMIHRSCRGYCLAGIDI